MQIINKNLYFHTVEIANTKKLRISFYILCSYNNTNDLLG